jgi:hypothetical protein
MAAYEQSIRRFVRYVTLDEVAPRARVIVPDAPNLQHSLSDRTMWSYGRHFPLGTYVPARGNVPALWLINGDTWSRGWSSTPNHQATFRAAIAQAITDAAELGKRVQSIIIPMSALDGAGINVRSIRPVQIREDRTERFVHTAKIPADVLARPVLTREQCEAASLARDPRGRAIHGSQALDSSLHLAVKSESMDNGAVASYTMTAKLTRSICYVGYDYSMPNPRDDGSGYDSPGGWRDYGDTPELSHYLDGNHVLELGTVDDDGMVTVTWETSRHWLGDSLFTALRAGSRKRMRYLSSFDYNEPWPLYFLAALPHTSRAMTVEDAVYDLAPAAVHAARARGIDVQRQGDIFAIATQYSDDDIAKMADTRCRLFAWTHGDKVRWRPGELGYVEPMTAKQSAEFKRMRTRLFRQRMAAHMSTRPITPDGFRRERRATLAKLKESLARSVERALVGDDVCKCDHHAYSYGADSAAGTPGTKCQTCGLPVYYRGFTAANAARNVEREREAIAAWYRDDSRVTKRMSGYASSAPYSRKHGKCYNRALLAWQRANEETAARFRRTPVDRAAIRTALAVYGTAHTATEVVTTSTGATYVRGVLKHVPGIAGDAWRNRDHRPVKLDNGKTWYLAVRNTVPRV